MGVGVRRRVPSLRLNYVSGHWSKVERGAEKNTTNRAEDRAFAPADR